MAGAHPEVALQGDQPLQGLQNLGIAPPHKVRAPTGAGKEGVPAEEDVPHPVSHRPGGVARGVEHLDGGAAEGDGVPLLHGVDALHRGQEHVLVPCPGPVDLLLVDVDGNARPLLQQAGDPQHVVKVAVGDENHGEGEARLADLPVNVLRLVAGINDGAELGVGVLQQVAVGADLAHGHTFDLQHKSPRCPPRGKN